MTLPSLVLLFFFRRGHFCISWVIDLSSKTCSVISIFHIQYFHSLVARFSILLFLFVSFSSPVIKNVAIFCYFFPLNIFLLRTILLVSAQIRSRFDFCNLSLANSHNLMTSLVLFNVLLKVSVPKGNGEQETKLLSKLLKP